jgi:hypothetical protein
MTPKDRLEALRALREVRDSEQVNMLDRLGVAKAADSLDHEDTSRLIGTMDTETYAEALRALAGPWTRAPRTWP